MESKTALVLGGTGLTGGFLIEKLCKSNIYSKVISYSRRKPQYNHPKLVWKEENFENVSNIIPPIADDIFCCLGTTMKSAGSKEIFTKIDFEIPTRVAEMLESESRRFFLMSSIGANPNSSNFYLKTKGNLEEKVKSLTYKSVLILQPSLLLGPRNEKRMGENFAKSLDTILQKIKIPIVQKYNGIEAELVAQVFLEFAKKDFLGVTILDSLEIKRINNN
jgi:uncharacterized protein YbjT (DUF2867 family)